MCRFCVSAAASCSLSAAMTADGVGAAAAPSALGPGKTAGEGFAAAGRGAAEAGGAVGDGVAGAVEAVGAVETVGAAAGFFASAAPGCYRTSHTYEMARRWDGRVKKRGQNGLARVVCRLLRRRRARTT
jgi:hypothetical protein